MNYNADELVRIGTVGSLISVKAKMGERTSVHLPYASVWVCIETQRALGWHINMSDCKIRKIAPKVDLKHYPLGIHPARLGILRDPPSGSYLKKKLKMTYIHYTFTNMQELTDIRFFESKVV